MAKLVPGSSRWLCHPSPTADSMASPTHSSPSDLLLFDAKVGPVWPGLAPGSKEQQSPAVMVNAKEMSSYASAVKGNIQTNSFASVVATPRLVPRFKPIDLPSRQYSTVDGKPSVHFTAAEFEAGVALFKHSLVAKFTMGRPTMEVIRQVFQENWPIKGRATVSDICDSRHLMIISYSEEDANAVLTSPLRKVGHAMFRLFRYSPDYSPKKESSTTTKWVRLPGIHPGFVTRNSVASIVNSFGCFLDLNERSKACATLRYVRTCVELDVCIPIPEEVRISLSDGRVFWQKIEVEGNMAYCSYYKVHGHDLSMCRKKHVSKSVPKEQFNMPVMKEHNPIEIIIQNSPEGPGEEVQEETPNDPKSAVVASNEKEAGYLNMAEASIISSLKDNLEEIKKSYDSVIPDLILTKEDKIRFMQDSFLPPGSQIKPILKHPKDTNSPQSNRKVSFSVNGSPV
ncbi:hypothetical protein QQ045_028285 [Rhodiola kirilowii]